MQTLRVRVSFLLQDTCRCDLTRTLPTGNSSKHQRVYSELPRNASNYLLEQYMKPYCYPFSCHAAGGHDGCQVFDIVVDTQFGHLVNKYSVLQFAMKPIKYELQQSAVDL